MNFLKKFFSGSGENDEGDPAPDLDSAQREMIAGINGLSDTMAKGVMVPRVDVVFISDAADLEEMVKTVIECGHSRLPVFNESADNVIGILYAKDLLSYLFNKEEFDIKKILRPSYFVPESKRLDDLLVEFKRRHVHIAITVDEYGGVSGIVCLEDIIEEIIGDIQDEFDDELEEIISRAENRFSCDTRMRIEDVNAALQLQLDEENFDTLGGFVFDLFGRIPARGETISWENIEFKIEEIDGHKISRIELTINKKSD